MRRSYIYAESVDDVIAKLHDRFPNKIVIVKSIEVLQGKFIIGSRSMRFFPNGGHPA